jgi:hypothetical protein
MASSSSIKAGSAYVELLLSDSKFIKGLDKAAARLRAFGAGVTGIGTRIAAGASAILSALTGTTAVFSEMGDALAKMSGRTGITVETLSELAYAAELSGTDVATLENSVRRMQKTLVEAAKGSSSASEALGQLNLTVADLQGKSPDEQFKLIADRLSQVQSPALRAALAMKIFGKSGAQLLPLMQDGAAGIEALQKEARDLGLTMSTEDAKAAEVLNDTMDRLWKVIKRTTFVIGSALAPTVEKLAGFITRAIVGVNNWVQANKELIVSVFKIAGIVLGVGATLIGLGLAITALGGILGALVTIAGAVGAAIGTIGSILAAILSPIGLVIAAVVGLGAYLIYVSGVGADALAWLGDRFTELKDFAVAAFGGIADALAAGDIALAGKILWLTLRVAFEKGVGWLQSIWLTFRGFFIQTAYDAFYGALAAWEIIQNGLTVAWIETTAFLSKTWTNFTSGFTQAWNDAINWTSKRLLELQGLFDSSLDVDAAKKLADQDLASANAEIERQKQAALGEREQQRAAERQQAEKDHQGELARIGQESIDKQKSLEDSNAAKVKAAEDELAKAKKELQDAIAEARQKRDAKDANAPKRPDRPKDAPDALAGLSGQLAAARERTISVAGTFNAFEARGLGSGGVADRIAKASEETAKNTKKLLDEMQNLDGSEFD